MKAITYLRKLAEKRRPGEVQIFDCGNGHIQIQGRLLVNYYPESRKRTAYLDATKEGRHGISPEQALKMAFQAPPITDVRAKRSKQSGAKRRMLAKAVSIGGKYRCMWCVELFDKSELTVEHVIPLARGGLDNSNNKGLACQPCNNGRGHDMPELARAGRKIAAP